MPASSDFYTRGGALSSGGGSPIIGALSSGPASSTGALSSNGLTPAMLQMILAEMSKGSGLMPGMAPQGGQAPQSNWGPPPQAPQGPMPPETAMGMGAPPGSMGTGAAPGMGPPPAMGMGVPPAMGMGPPPAVGMGAPPGMGMDGPKSPEDMAGFLTWLKANGLEGSLGKPQAPPVGMR